MRSVVKAVLLALAACNNAPDPPALATVPCETAGGHCILGLAACSNPGPQTCPVNAGAPRCCFDPTPSGAPTAGGTAIPPATRDAAAEACAPSGCTGSCADISAHNVLTFVGGCVVWHCCVPGDAGAEGESADSGPE